MNTFYTVVLYSHVAAGFLALLAGCMAMVLQKGGRRHRSAGKVFVAAMYWVSVSAIGLSFVNHHRFLMHVGIFAFFMNYFGFRAVRNKTLKANLVDWLVLLIALTNAGLMIASGHLILWVFGGISVFLSIGQLRSFLLVIRHREIPKLQWLRQHIGMMTGAYIATFTAFLVVNISGFDPAWALWLTPTFVLVPLIFYWSRKYTHTPPTVIRE